MPSKNSERRKIANRIKAYRKWANYYEEIHKCKPTDDKLKIFYKAFNMGWKAHKKESKKGFKRIMRYVKSRQQKIPKCRICNKIETIN